MPEERQARRAAETRRLIDEMPLQVLRKALELTQQQVAAALGINPVALSMRISLMTATHFTGRWPVISAEGGTPVRGREPVAGAQRRRWVSVTARWWGWSRGSVVFAWILR